MQRVNYDEICKIYDDVREGDVELLNHFLAELPRRDGLVILDIGCGTGNYTDLFERLTREHGFVIHGVEPSEGMLDKARQKNAHLRFHQGTATEIPLDDASVDFAYMTDVIHHVRDIAAMFVEIRRVLRPGGKLCIATQSHRQIEARPIVQFFPGTVRVDKERYPDIDEVIAAGERGGLKCLRQDILFAGDVIELGADYLQLVSKKGYSMLHLITDAEYEEGLRRLKDALRDGPVQGRMAGETLVWFMKE